METTEHLLMKFSFKNFKSYELAIRLYCETEFYQSKKSRQEVRS